MYVIIKIICSNPHAFIYTAALRILFSLKVVIKNDHSGFFDELAIFTPE